ncbi:hypothetical protein L6164_021191 [Bauhinia variegata]|uniref:Uncharacterized protein n=1 Tax=Bauhinia variegata TaxID=167791 RepID=A0ACB9MXR8_BAUVA|nr:hypothetical protein L6164_021191 [Bauhinia variegata]
MVLAQLGEKISCALQKMRNSTVVDEGVLNECINEINRELIIADVDYQLLSNMVNRIKEAVVHRPVGHNKRIAIEQAVFKELFKMLDPGKPSFTPEKGKTSVVILVGLQGSGKTTTCTKYAYYYKKKGFKPALVCADTFRACALDQLSKMHKKPRSLSLEGARFYTVIDPVEVAVEGVELFKKETRDLIIVDTSGRHKQDNDLFEELRQLSEATKPDLVIFVMDSSIGKAAFSQARAFKQSVAVGAVIVTKMDGHAKGGGALSAIAATKSPVIFIGNGERVDDFEDFDVDRFVRRLLGKYFLFMNKIHEVVPMDQQSELLQKCSKGDLSLRMIFELSSNMDHLIQVFSKLPKLVELDRGKEGMAKAKAMMNSMTNEELDSSNPVKLINESRKKRIARGSGCKIHEVTKLIEMYKELAKKYWSLMKGFKMPKKGDMNALSRSMSAQHMGKVPPRILRQIGSISGLEDLMAQIGSNSRL